jgi:S-phase kinase-associated protein 1
MVTANVLAIPPLIELTCGKVASLMKGKTPEEITVFFKISPASEDEDE